MIELEEKSATLIQNTPDRYKGKLEVISDNYEGVLGFELSESYSYYENNIMRRCGHFCNGYKTSLGLCDRCNMIKLISHGMIKDSAIKSSLRLKKRYELVTIFEGTSLHMLARLGFGSLSICGFCTLSEFYISFDKYVKSLFIENLLKLSKEDGFYVRAKLDPTFEWKSSTQKANMEEMAREIGIKIEL